MKTWLRFAMDRDGCRCGSRKEISDLCLGVSPVRSVLPTVTASDLENSTKSGSTIDADAILIRDGKAARRWLISVIAARAVEIHRERRKRSEKQAIEPDGDDHGHGDATADGERDRRRR